ncbi:hypothetical protein TVAG_440170 [Trichomonas vaginalis G3]|uniref:Uncharacterized protein n=1 Tax=Trichomonas vaginalis (strain ATCC PRA-98 / G3) TaxID=412133 RepID=A2FDM0_TRIV3|nr:hypothetical protein TVAGG3_0952610 [Trichomonas vaginalis G3]EAX97001.1 hypothetical protein TVAG_440170 [Trichomonas vaginalis G3]KAI5487320.1 hypothetical protein TVAGG3_0952610 [Trichomonas vaginalis G3]|eukprot:XP_001309931.1 hypothetical protein [Trichomonas vaginalis G3]
MEEDYKTSPSTQGMDIEREDNKVAEEVVNILLTKFQILNDLILEFGSNINLAEQISKELDETAGYLISIPKNKQNFILENLEYQHIGNTMKIIEIIASFSEISPEFKELISKELKIIDILSSIEEFSFLNLSQYADLFIFQHLSMNFTHDEDIFTRILSIIRKSLFSDAADITVSILSIENVLDLVSHEHDLFYGKNLENIIMITFYYANHPEFDPSNLSFAIILIFIKDDFEDPTSLCFFFWSIYYLINGDRFDYDHIDDLFSFLDRSLHHLNFETKVLLTQVQQRYLIPLLKIYSTLSIKGISIPALDPTLLVRIMQLASSDLFSECENLILLNIIHRSPEERVDFMNYLIGNSGEIESSKKENILYIIASIINSLSDDILRTIISPDLLEFLFSTLDQLSIESLKVCIKAIYRLWTSLIPVSNVHLMKDFINENDYLSSFSDISEEIEDEDSIEILDKIIAECSD